MANTAPEQEIAPMPGDKGRKFKDGNGEPPFADVAGAYWFMYTRMSRPVLCWVPNAGAGDLGNANGYFCHGLSLGTFAQAGYSVMGGYMNRVFEDECTEITAGVAGAYPGDIVAFVGGELVYHTCVVALAVQSPKNASNVWVDTKNGRLARERVRLEAVILDYKGYTIRVYRKRPVLSLIIPDSPYAPGYNPGFESKAS